MTTKLFFNEVRDIVCPKCGARLEGIVSSRYYQVPLIVSEITWVDPCKYLLNFNKYDAGSQETELEYVECTECKYSGEIDEYELEEK